MALQGASPDNGEISLIDFPWPLNLFLCLSVCLSDCQSGTLCLLSLSMTKSPLFSWTIANFTLFSPKIYDSF